MTEADNQTAPVKPSRLNRLVQSTFLPLSGVFLRSDNAERGFHRPDTTPARLRYTGPKTAIHPYCIQHRAPMRQSRV